MGPKLKPMEGDRFSSVGPSPISHLPSPNSKRWRGPKQLRKASVQRQWRYCLCWWCSFFRGYSDAREVGGQLRWPQATGFASVTTSENDRTSLFRSHLPCSGWATQESLPPLICPSSSQTLIVLITLIYLSVFLFTTWFLVRMVVLSAHSFISITSFSVSNRVIEWFEEN